MLVAHNLSYDCHQTRETLGIDMLDQGKPVLDTDLLARVVLPERAWAVDGGYKLKDLAKTYLREDAQAAEDTIKALAESIGVRLQGDNATPAGYYIVWQAYPAEMEAYAKLDAEYARDLLPILEAKLNPSLTKCWTLEQAMTPVVIGAEQRGVRVDPDVVEALRIQHEPLRTAAQATVERDLAGVNLGSPKQLAEALTAMGVPLYRKTDSGELTTAAFALQEFEEDWPVLKALSQWRAADKMLNTYIGPMTGREVVHTSFWQIGAKTGRMACSRPNMQNLPGRKETGDTKLREVFIPRPGYCFLVNDYDSIELRLLAYYLNDPAFIRLIESGRDAFAWLAAQVYGGEPADYAKGTPGQKRRDECKNVTYAIVYGAGARRVSDMLNLPPGPPLDGSAWMVQRGYAKVGDPSYEPGRKLIAKVKGTLPRYQDFAGRNGRVARKINTSGFITTLMGRKQTVARDKSYVGPNALIQGGAADIFKQGAVDAARATAHLDCHTILFVHDELVHECLMEHAAEAQPLIQAAMVAAYDLTPKLAVTGAVCLKNYAEGK